MVRGDIGNFGGKRPGTDHGQPVKKKKPKAKVKKHAS